MLDRILEAAREVATRLRSPRSLRLLARARRNQNVLLAALLGLGILLMVIHWSGSPTPQPHAQRAADARASEHRVDPAGARSGEAVSAAAGPDHEPGGRRP